MKIIKTVIIAILAIGLFCSGAYVSFRISGKSKTVINSTLDIVDLVRRCDLTVVKAKKIRTTHVKRQALMGLFESNMHYTVEYETRYGIRTDDIVVEGKTIHLPKPQVLGTGIVNVFKLAEDGAFLSIPFDDVFKDMASGIKEDIKLDALTMEEVGQELKNRIFEFLNKLGLDGYEIVLDGKANEPKTPQFVIHS